jgi:hypothetical protein
LPFSETSCLLISSFQILVAHFSHAWRNKASFSENWIHLP